MKREVKLDSLKTLMIILDLAFGDQNKSATVKRELLKFKQWNCALFLYYAKFQWYIANVKWNPKAQMDDI